MHTFKNILLIRAGSANKNKVGHPVHNPPPLPLKYAKALLDQNKDYQTHLMDFWVDDIPFEDLLHFVDEQSVDTIVVSISSPASEAGISLCAKLKEHRDVFIAIVGSDVSEKHEYYLTLSATYDVLIRGEFELEIKVLMDKLNHQDDILQITDYYNQEKSKESLRVENLDDLPVLEWDHEELKKYPYIYPLRFGRRVVSGYISTSRGCPHACTFCSPTVRKSYGRSLRLRGPNKVVDDIEQLTKMGVNVVSFEDDDFTLNKEHVTAICQEICKRGIRIKWASHARVDEVNQELLKTMKKAGCVLLLFGIESGSQKIVNILHKSSVRSGWRQRAKEAFKQVRKAGIASCAMFIVGSPSEAEEDVMQSIELSYQMRPDLIKVHFFTLYPGSVDYKQYQENNSGGLSPYHYLKPVVNLSDMDLTELKKVQRMFYKRYLFRPSFVFSHLFHYLPYYLCNSPMSWKLVISGLKFLFLAEKAKNEKTIESGTFEQVESY